MTAFRLIDPDNPLVEEVTSDWILHDLNRGQPITHDRLTLKVKQTKYILGIKFYHTEISQYRKKNLQSKKILDFIVSKIIELPLNYLFKIFW